MPYGKGRAAARSQERPPADVDDDDFNDDELPPVDSEEHRDLPPHLGEPSTSRVGDPPYRTGNTLHLSSVDPSALERILERQQQQLTTALATQQQTMMASFQQMFANILTSHATTANTAPAGNHNTIDYSRSKMRLNDPDPFDGLPKNTESFINSCVNIFMAQPQLYSDAESQVRFALSFLKSGALKWRDGMLRDIKNGAYVITDWNDFERQLWLNFGNKHLVEEAQRGLHNIHQGSRTAEEFFIAFEDLKAEAGFNDAAVIFELLRALRPDVHDEVNRRNPRPIYYSEWKETILQVDQNLRENAASSSFYNPHGRPQAHFTHNYTPGARGFSNRFQPTPRIVDTPTVIPTATSAPRVSTTSAPRPAIPTIGTTPAGSSSKTFVPTCWKCGGPHWPRQCETTAKPSSAVTRQLFDKVDELDSHMETVRKLFEEVEELPEDADEDRGLMEKLMEEHPLFFTPTDG
jgi:hypothetical protein